MRVKIYQGFFDPKQYRHLDKAFIPFSNIENEKPDWHEYPLLKKLHEKNINYTGYWGLVSWRWKEKTKMDGKDYISWIKSNPGYDVYLINPFPHVVESYNNSMCQGETDHPGITNCADRFLKHLGYDFTMECVTYPLNIFSTCHYYVGKAKFWDKWIAFLDLAIEVASRDQEMYDWLFVKTCTYRDKQLINFPFFIERLVSLFLYLNSSEYKVLHYPYQKIMHKTAAELEYTDMSQKALQLRENTIY